MFIDEKNESGFWDGVAFGAAMGAIDAIAENRAENRAKKDSIAAARKQQASRIVGQYWHNDLRFATERELVEVRQVLNMPVELISTISWHSA